MNQWVLILVAAILLLHILNGRRRGLVKTVFSLFSVIVAMVVTATVAPMLSKQLQNNETVYVFVEDKVTASLDVYIEDMEESSVAVQNEVIQGLPLPEAVKDMLVENKNAEVYQAMAVEGLRDYVIKYITGVVINAGSFIVVFIVVNIAIRILAVLLDIISKLPVLNTLNKTGGAVIGFLQGMLVIWLLCIVLMAFSSTELAKDVYAQINASKILTYIYDNNLLLETVINAVKILK